MARNPVVNLCIRRGLEWSDQRAVEATLRAHLRAKYDAWNATFTMPYHVFRQRLSAIALLNWSRVEGAVQSSWPNARPGAIVVPVDDDDWFSPELVSRLVAVAEPKTHMYLWSSGTIGYESRKTIIRRRLLKFIRRRGPTLCGTNSYGLWNVPNPEPLVLNHIAASRYFEEHLPAVQRIDAPLSMWNRSLASQTTLGFRRPTISRSELVTLLAKYKVHYLSWQPAAGLEWAAPYVILMHELMNELAVRPDAR